MTPATWIALVAMILTVIGSAWKLATVLGLVRLEIAKLAVEVAQLRVLVDSTVDRQREEITNTQLRRADCASQFACMRERLAKLER